MNAIKLSAWGEHADILAGHPLCTAAVTLAIGIGANAAIFTLIDDAMLRSLPVLRPDELVTVGFKGPKMPEIVPAQSLSGLEQLRRQLRSVEGPSGWSPDMLSVPDQQGTLRSIEGEMVSGDALGMLGVRPYLGRVLTSVDDLPGGPVGGWPAVIGYGFWQDNYHGDPGDFRSAHLSLGARGHRRRRAPARLRRSSGIFVQRAS